MKRIKWENIVFIGLSICYIINAFKIQNNAIETLLIQELIIFITCVGIKYLRKHPNEVLKDLKDLFCE